MTLEQDLTALLATRGLRVVKIVAGNGEEALQLGVPVLGGEGTFFHLIISREAPK